MQSARQHLRGYLDTRTSRKLPTAHYQECVEAQSADSLVRAICTWKVQSKRYIYYIYLRRNQQCNIMRRQNVSGVHFLKIRIHFMLHIDRRIV